MYAGHVTLKGDRLPGRHEAIVPEELFAQVERIRQSPRGRRAVPRRDIYLLRGIVRCSVDLSRYDAGGTPLCVEHGEEPRVSSDDPPPPIPPAPRAQCRGDKCNVEVPEGQQCRPCTVKAVDAWLMRRDGPLARSAPTALSSGELADVAKRDVA